MVQGFTVSLCLQCGAEAYELVPAGVVQGFTVRLCLQSGAGVYGELGPAVWYRGLQ